MNDMAAATKPVRLKDATLLREANLVGGQWVGAADGATIAIIDPAG